MTTRSSMIRACGTKKRPSSVSPPGLRAALSLSSSHNDANCDTPKKTRVSSFDLPSTILPAPSSPLPVRCSQLVESNLLHTPGKVPTYKILDSDSCADSTHTICITSSAADMHLNPDMTTAVPPSSSINTFTTQSTDTVPSIWEPERQHVYEPIVVTAVTSDHSTQPPSDDQPPLVDPPPFVGPPHTTTPPSYADPSPFVAPTPDTALTSEPLLFQTLINKIDKIAYDISHVSARVGVIESEIRALHTLNEKVSDMEKSLKFIGDAYDDISRQVRQNSDVIQQLNRQRDADRQTNQDLTRRLADMENRSMRDNLLFTGVPEQRGEDTETVVKDVIHRAMGINLNIDFERVHRIGPPRHNKHRTIVAKFSRFKDRETVRRNAKNLKGTTIGIQEQYNKETNDKRSVLYPEYRAARNNNKYAKMVHDYLIVDDEKFRVDQFGKIYKDNDYRPPPPRANYQHRPPLPHASNQHRNRGDQDMNTGRPPHPL